MAFTFISPDEQYNFSRIEELLGAPVRKIQVPQSLGESPEYNPSKRRITVGKEGTGASLRSH